MGLKPWLLACASVAILAQFGTVAETSVVIMGACTCTCPKPKSDAIDFGAVHLRRKRRTTDGYSEAENLEAENEEEKEARKRKRRFLWGLFGSRSSSSSLRSTNTDIRNTNHKTVNSGLGAFGESATGAGGYGGKNTAAISGMGQVAFHGGDTNIGGPAFWGNHGLNIEN